MSTLDWLKKLRRKLGNASDAQATRRERHLRLIQLEDRRVLNATVALVGMELQITGLEASELTVSGVDFDFDGGGGDPAVPALRFELSSGNWSGAAGLPDADLGPPANRVLHVRLDAGAFESVSVIGANDVNNLLRLDFSQNDPLESLTTFSFDGGDLVDDSDNDGVELTGYNVSTLTVTHLAAAPGVRSETGTVVLDAGGELQFDNIEPLILAGNAADLVINLPAGPDATVVLSDDGTAADPDAVNDANTSAISGLFEFTQFTNPTSSLTINDGTGAKTISVRGLDASFDADLTISDQDAIPDNLVSFDTNATDTGSGNLTVTAGSISVDEAITTGGGDVTLTAESTVDSMATGDITTTGAAAGDSSGFVTISAGGSITLDGDIDTSGFGANSDGGPVTLESLDGDITTAAIDASAGAGGAAADIVVTAQDAAIDATATGSITISGALSVNEDAAVTLTADNAIAINADITSAGSGAVTVTANDDGATDGGTEDIAMAAASVIDAGAGTIALSTAGTSGGNITLGRVVTTNSTNTAVTINSQGNITGAAGENVVATNGRLVADAVTGINLRTNIASLNASTGGTGSIVIDETNDINLFDVDTADGAIDVTAAGLITARDVDSSATDSDLNDITLTSTGDSIDVVTVRAAANAAAQNDVTLSAAGSINDADPGADNVDVIGQDVSLMAAAGDIGDASFNPATNDVFKFAFDTLEVEAFDNLAATAAESIAVSLAANPSASLTLNAATVYVDSAADIDSTAILLTATNLALVTAGTVTVADAGLVIDGDLRISAANVRAATLGNDVILGSAAVRVDRLLYDVTAADDELVVVFADQIDVLTASDIEMTLNGATQITDVDCNFTGIDTGNNTVVLRSVGGPVTQGTNVDPPAGPPGLNDRILSNELLLLGDGPFTLQNADNDVNIFAADSQGQILFTDTDGLTVGEISEVIAGTAHQGIITSNDNVKLTVGANLAINEAVNLNGGDLFLMVGGNVTQQAGDTITADGLALMVDGTATLNEANTVATFAANNGGTTQFTNSIGFEIGSVTVDTMNVTGVTTSNDDVKLTVTTGNLAINEDVSLNGGDLFLMVDGNVTQQAGATIFAGGLGMIVGGTVTLDEANDVDSLAADNQDRILFTDADGFTIGQVAVAGMTATGITTSNDDVRLTATTGDVTIDEDVSVGIANIRFDVTGNLTQQTNDTIAAAGLALRVGGTTTLLQANDVDTFAADNGGQTQFTNADGFVVGAVLADGVNVVGVTTSNDDTKLTATTGNLDLNEQVNVSTADLILVAGGNVAQQAGDIITAGGLGLMVDGTTTLNEANVVGIFAADNDGLTLFTDADELTVGQVAVAAMTIDGLTTGDDDVKLTLGNAAMDNFIVNNAVDLGTGSLFVMAGGTATQAVGGTITSGGLGLMVNGSITLNSANSVAVFAADSNAEVQFTSATGFVVGTVDVNGMSVTGVDSNNSDIKLTTSAGSLAINNAINAGTANVFLMIAANVTQQATGTITAAGLGTMVSGTTTLDEANDVDSFAADNGGQTLFTDIDDLTISTVSAGGMSATGITTTNDSVRLTVGSAGGHNLAINEAVALGAGSLFLDVGGNVTQLAAGTISAEGLGMIVDGTTLLDQANNVTTLAANNGGTVTYNDVNALTIGSVSVVASTATGITTTNDDVLLNADGSLTINEAVNSGGPGGTADVRLTADGNVTQSAAGTILTDQLGVRNEAGAGSIVLGQANDVNVVAIRNSAPNGSVSFTDSNSVLIDEVAAQADGLVSFAATTSVTSDNGDITLVAALDLTTAATRDITSAGGNIVIQAGNDFVTGTDSDIDSGSGTITADATRDITLDGNVTTNGSTIDLQGGRNLTTLINRDITSGGGDILLDAGQDITTGAGSDIDAAGGSITGTAGRDMRFFGNTSTVNATIDLGAMRDMTTESGRTVTAQGGDITISAGATLRILGDVTSEVAGTTTPEIITLSGADVFIGFDNRDNSQHMVNLSTDDVPAGSLAGTDATTEGLRIIADNPAVMTMDGMGNNVADGTVTLGNMITVRTDGGVATNFAARPSPGGVGTAFFESPGDPIPATINNDPFGPNGFLNAFEIVVGVTGEENLRIYLDWRDPSNDGAITDPLPAPIMLPVTSNRYQTIVIEQGGMTQTLAHVYFDIEDLVPFSLANITDIIIDFSVSHHETIQVFGGMVTQNAATNAVTGGQVSSTDNPATGSFNPLNPANAPVDDTAFTGVGSTNQATDDLDLNFEGGRVEFLLVTTFLPPIEVEAEPIVPAPAAAAVSQPVVEEPVFVAAVAPAEFANGGYSTQSEDFYQLRQEGRDEPVVDRIAEEFGENLMRPKRLREYVKQEPRIDNGTGYELWLITTKVNENGQTVTIERPVLKFDVFNREPTPATEDLPEVFPELRLIPMPVDEPDAAPDGANASDDGTGAAEQPAVDALPGSDAVPPEQPPEVRPQQEPGDDADQVLLNPAKTGHVATQFNGESRLAQSAAAGLLVTGVLRRSEAGSSSVPAQSLSDRLRKRMGL